MTNQTNTIVTVLIALILLPAAARAQPPTIKLRAQPPTIKLRAVATDRPLCIEGLGCPGDHAYKLALKEAMRSDPAYGAARAKLVSAMLGAEPAWIPLVSPAMTPGGSGPLRKSALASRGWWLTRSEADAQPQARLARSGDELDQRAADGNHPISAPLHAPPEALQQISRSARGSTSMRNLSPDGNSSPSI
jgi:hypothetical protein